MAFLHSDVLDNGLSVLSGATSTALHLCHTMPTDRASAIANSVGNKASPSIGAPAARTPSGRKVTVAAITSGSPGNITATSTGAADDAQYWALIDGTRLLAAGDLSAAQMVANGNTFTTSAFDIGIPAPA